MSQRESDRDSKTDRLICDPWNGSRSPEFRKFERNIKCDLLGYFLPEDECSIWDAMIDMDQGGQANGALAMPGQNQNGHAQAVRKRKKRQAKAFSIIYKHIDNERLREMLDALAQDDRVGVAAWQLIQRECAQTTNDLFVLDVRRDFENASIEKDIGYTEDSMTSFGRLLSSLNARIPAGKKYSDDDMAVKLLSNITHPEALAASAVEELAAAPGARKFELVVNGNPIRNFTAIIMS